MRAPDSVRGPARKRSLGLDAFAHESNAAEWVGLSLGNRDTQMVEKFDSIRHQALAAGLVDRWNRAIRYHHA